MKKIKIKHHTPREELNNMIVAPKTQNQQRVPVVIDPMARDFLGPSTEEMGASSQGRPWPHGQVPWRNA
jgi:hypothetical protein